MTEGKARRQDYTYYIKVCVQVCSGTRTGNLSCHATGMLPLACH